MQRSVNALRCTWRLGSTGWYDRATSWGFVDHVLEGEAGCKLKQARNSEYREGCVVSYGVITCC
jgi:hypothetical protein